MRQCTATCLTYCLPLAFGVVLTVCEFRRRTCKWHRSECSRLGMTPVGRFVQSCDMRWLVLTTTMSTTPMLSVGASASRQRRKSSSSHTGESRALHRCAFTSPLPSCPKVAQVCSCSPTQWANVAPLEMFLQRHKLGQVGPVQIRVEAVAHRFKAPLFRSVPQITTEI